MSMAFPPTVLAGSIPSSPYLNWMTVPMVFLTVPSEVSLRSSRAETSLLCMYPDLEVLTAGSTRPSLPPMAWKKNSVGESPDLYELEQNPLAYAPRSPFSKWERVLFQYPLASLSPRTAC